MSNTFRIKYKNLIAILLMVIIIVPVIVQPGHYLIIEHEHYQHSKTKTFSTEKHHLKCSIDGFELTNVTLHSFIKVAQVVCLNASLKLPSKQIYAKRERLIHFSLRAPPVSV